ncbi:hypothetical protein LH51_00660 [Nitrincola sp. A-D6]|uniref:zinc-ribbon and DUF3426 domain-containing protein n=1 Tax=Nitrincola sp. A-D6 TaxID=1545442 RepID=UPI00051F9E04|nr:zinc-ribbon and DUF3426 domain-containing protein [Nitrincola sp. A-D6]KGK43352.1 hypothetical protein LH51_00660 [Nitrincola sp. A-D6]
MSKLVAQCPSCQTRYNVTPGQLKVADGRVRCGQCLTVFSVLNKIETASQIQTKPSSPDISLKSQPVKPKHNADPLTLLRQMRSEPPELTPAANLPAPRQTLAVAGSVLALVLLASQYLWFERAKLAQDPLLYPLYASLCVQFDCTPPSSQSLAWLQTSHLLVRRQPEQPDTLEVLTGLINTGPLAARLPVMRLHFTDASGRIVAADDFSPDIYLTDKQINRLQPGQQHQIRLLLQRPAPGQLGYELAWLPAAAH